MWAAAAVVFWRKARDFSYWVIDVGESVGILSALRSMMTFIHLVLSVKSVTRSIKEKDD